MSKLDELLNEIEQRADAATPGPWEAPDEGEESRDGRRALYSAEPNHYENAGLGNHQTTSLLAGDGWHGASHTLAHPADAEFIADARTTVPRLVKALREAVVEIKHASEQNRPPCDKYTIEQITRILEGSDE